MSRSFILLAVVILACLGVATAIRCFSCSSSGTPAQADCNLPAAGYLKDCGVNTNICYKTKGMVGNVETYTRDCGRFTGTGASDIGDNNCQEHDVNGVKTVICNCNRDSCNAAGSLGKMTFGVAGMSILISLMLAKL